MPTTKNSESGEKSIVFVWSEVQLFRPAPHVINVLMSVLSVCQAISKTQDPGGMQIFSESNLRKPLCCLREDVLCSGK